MVGGQIDLTAEGSRLLLLGLILAGIDLIDPVLVTPVKTVERRE